MSIKTNNLLNGESDVILVNQVLASKLNLVKVEIPKSLIYVTLHRKY